MIPAIDLVHGEPAVLHCVYTVMYDEAIFYVGMCELKRLEELPDAQFNTEFWKTVQPGEHIRVSIVQVTPYLDQAQMGQNSFIDVHQPHCNVNGTQLPEQSRKRRPVRCTTDGAVFSTQQAACDHYNLDPSALSRHLNGVPSHITVGGHKFIYEV